MLLIVLASVLTAMLESVPHYREEYGEIFHLMEWGFTLVFTFEYILRVIAIGEPWRYMGSFFGVIDLISILPTYIEFVVHADCKCCPPRRGLSRSSLR